MKKNVIAAQLYTLRDHLKTPSDIASTLKKVKAIGYDAVQVSGMGPIETKELNKILAGEGLVCCATHESGKMIVEDTAAVIARLQELNCRYTAYPYPHTPLDSEAAVTALAKQLDAAGAKMRQAGQVLTYHNHAIELQRFNGKFALDLIYDGSSPQNLQGEIDTYWIQAGGCDPVAWCSKLKNRLPLLHLKDYGVIGNDAKMFEVGYGSLNWPAIVAAARAAGTEWFIVEEDTCRFDPFVSLKMSLDYLLAEIA